MEIVDPRCVPNLQLPSLNADYEYQLSQGSFSIDLTGALNGNCRFTLTATADGTDISDVRDNDGSAWMSFPAF